MNLPLYPYELISPALNLLLGLAIGVGFGFVLERGGLGDARKLVGQFLLKDMTVFKVMFTAIVTAMLGLFFLSWFSWINLQLLQISDSYLAPQLIGGLILGAGFGISRIGSAAVESMARQPEVAGNIQTGMIISAALIEGATFFGLIVCML